MKKLISIILFLSSVWVQAAEVKVEAQLTNATVYLQGATLYNKAKVQIPSGVSIVKLTNISYLLQNNSLQVSGKGDFTILDVKYQTNYVTQTEPTKEIAALELRKRELVFQERSLQDKISVYNNDILFLQKNMDIKGNNTGVSSIELEKVANVIRNRMLDVKSKILSFNEELQKTSEELRKIENQLRSLKGSQLPSGEVLVTVSSNATQTVELFANYYIAQASWIPMYDIRVTDITKAVTISYKAKVYQNSGLQWNNIKLNLSTGNPSLGGDAPILQAWWLRNITHETDDKVNYLSISNTANAVIADYKEVAYDSMELRKEKSFSKAISVDVQQQITTTEFVINEPLSIQSNDLETTVQIKEYEVPAQYSYVCTPKLDADVFLRAKITGFESYNFLSGVANLYFQGAYVGESYFNLDKAVDTLAISLGRDKGVVVERKRIDEFKERKFLSGKRKELQTWEISIKNNKQNPITIVVTDQIPLSSQSEIEVTDVQHPEGGLDKESGKVSWVLEIPKAGSKKVKISYQITYPKDWNVNTK